MSICNDKYYVGVPELQRRVDTERRLQMERGSLELRVRRWNSGERTGDSYERLTSDVGRHNDSIRAYNRSVSDYRRPGCR